MSSKSRQRGGSQLDRSKHPRPVATSAAIRRPVWKLILVLILGSGAIVCCGAWLWNQFGKSSKKTPLALVQPTPPAKPAVHPRRATQNDPAFITLVNRGTELLAQGKTVDAEQVFREAIQMNPADEDVHYDLGLALTRLGKIDEGIQQYQEALRLFPDYVEAHNNLGNLLVRSGKTDQAIQHFEEALKIMPDYASAHNNLGSAFQRTGRTNEAIVHFERAVQINPDYWEAHFNVASTCLQAGRLSEARRELETVLRLQPAFQPAQAALTELDARRAASPQ